jgi:L-galactose dehydrogenase/L-glyceraldehyde 3-phosphate reductase
MRYRTVGTTGVKISEIGFGCGNNAVLMVKAPYEEQVKVVRRALDAGITFFDTAFAYGLGKSEENLGRILKNLGVNPIVSTKIRLEADCVSDIKAAAIRAVEAGLERLGRERVDFVQLHTRVTQTRGMEKRFSLTPNDVLGPGGVIDGFKAMRGRGKVGFFGFSGLGETPALHELVDSGEFHGFQCYYNLLNPSAGQPVQKNFSAQDYGLILERAAAKGMGAFIIRVLAAGALTADPSAGGGGSGQTLSPGSDYPSDLQRTEKVKTALGVAAKDLTQAAIRFGLMHQTTAAVLVGFSTTTHVDEAVACSEMAGLSDAQMGKMRKLWGMDFND